MAIDPDLSHVLKEIDQLLRDRRPDRYHPNVEGDTEWLDNIAEEVAPLIPDAKVREVFARKLVGQREGQATRSTNAFIREIEKSGQPPLDWFDYANDPISVITREFSGGREVVTEERVALRATTSRDFRLFAIEERRRAANEFATRNSTCEAAEWIADQIDLAGVQTFRDWAEEQ